MGHARADGRGDRRRVHLADGATWTAVNTGIPNASGYYSAAFNGQIACAADTSAAATSAAV